MKHFIQFSTILYYISLTSVCFPLRIYFTSLNKYVHPINLFVITSFLMCLSAFLEILVTVLPVFILSLYNLKTKFHLFSLFKFLFIFSSN